jgi:hypothetical protein
MILLPRYKSSGRVSQELVQHSVEAVFRLSAVREGLPGEPGNNAA